MVTRRNIEEMQSSRERNLFDLIGYGLFQKRVLLALFLIAANNMFYSYMIVYMTTKDDYWCVSNIEGPSINNVSWIRNNFSANNTWRGMNKEECYIHATPEQGDQEAEPNNSSVPCTKWEYGYDYYNKSIVSEWDLVCDSEFLISLSKSVFQIGYAFCVFTGYISDRIGRFPVVIGAAVVQVVSSILSFFSTSYTMFVFLRFLIGASRITMSNTGYIILMEIVEPTYRERFSVIFQMGYSLGQILIPAVGWLVRRWTWIILTVEAINIPAMALLWFVPESPRWLLTKGKNNEFVKLVEKAARVNKREIQHENVELLVKERETQTSKQGVVYLLKQYEGRKRLIILFLNWMTAALLTYSVSYNVQDLAGNLYLNAFIIGIMGLLSQILARFVIHRVGRRKLLVSSGMVAASTLVVIAAIQMNESWITTALVMVVYFCPCFTYVVIFAYTAELFPTVVRNAAFSSCSTSSRIGSIAAPFMLDLAKATHSSVPNALIATFTTLSCALLFFLPETKGRPLEDTFQDHKTAAITTDE